MESVLIHRIFFIGTITKVKDNPDYWIFPS